MGTLRTGDSGKRRLWGLGTGDVGRGDVGIRGGSGAWDVGTRLVINKQHLILAVTKFRTGTRRNPSTKPKRYQ